MPAQPGTYRLGPESATLQVRTGKTGPASAGAHNLTLRVASWSAQLDLAASPEATTLSLSADSTSLEVASADGGVKPLSDVDKLRVKGNIDDKVLQRGTISFRSTQVRAGGAGQLLVRGELDLLGRTRPVEFTLTIGDDASIRGSATIVQTEFGITPFSAMMGALKVADAVAVTVEGRLPAP